MSLREQLPRIIACDPRYALEAYAFVLDAIHHARLHKLKSLERELERERDRDQPSPTAPERGARPGSSRRRRSPPPRSGHVTGRELCEAVRKLALRQYGLLAATVLAHWGLRSTSDIGDVVYNLIATGDLEKTPNDSRSDFNDVFDFETALRPKLVLARDELA